MDNLKNVLEYVFQARSIAIAGASENAFSPGYFFISHLIDHQFAGHIYPVNPSERPVLGLRTYPSIESIPGPVDYVICCLKASKVIQLLNECSEKGVKVVHMFTGRLSETGRKEAIDLEFRIFKEARRLGIRIIGSNSMGVYCPKQGISFAYNFPREAGTIGALAQSGGVASLLVQYGMAAGLRFSKVISYGNALDIDESELLDYFADDSETEIIAIYMEGIKDGKKFLNSLRNAAGNKQVIAIQGGLGTAGSRAAASHTAAISSSSHTWEAALRSAGAVQVEDIKELVGLVVAFSFLPPITSNKVLLAGDSGGMSVLAADICERAGLNVLQLPPAVKHKLKMELPEIWDWVGNPIDISILDSATGSFDEIIEFVPRLVIAHSNYDVMIAQVSEGNPAPYEIWAAIISTQVDSMLNMHREKLIPIVSVIDGGRITEDQDYNRKQKFLAEQQTRLANAKIPTYSTVKEAAGALSKFIRYWQEKVT